MKNGGNKAKTTQRAPRRLRSARFTPPPALFIVPRSVATPNAEAKGGWMEELAPPEQIETDIRLVRIACKQQRFMRGILSLSAIFLFWIMAAPPADAVRIKDIATIQNVRENQLQGLGLVVGLAGTGDSQTVAFTKQTVANFLLRHNITVPIAKAKTENAAVVSITATLPPFAKQGSKIKVTVSSIGDAESLQGGVLQQTPLVAANGDVYAVAQGPLIIGGFSAGNAGSSITQNHPTVGIIPGGAIVEREIPFNLAEQDSLTLILTNPDHTTAARMAQVINAHFGPISHAVDIASIKVDPPASRRGINLIAFISEMDLLRISPDTKARVVVNERTGTIVMGEDVRISTVAIAKGNLTVLTSSVWEVSQPGAFSDGETVKTKISATSVEDLASELKWAGGGTDEAEPGAEGEEPYVPPFRMVEEGVSIGEVVQALNAIGATPRDLIAILQGIQSQGGLQAELVVEH